MLTLQTQVIQFLNGLSDDNLRFLLDMIHRFMKPAQAMEKDTRGYPKMSNAGSAVGNDRISLLRITILMNATGK